jgi:hypothetical protein
LICHQNVSATSIKSAVLNLKDAGVYQKDTVYAAYEAYMSGAKLPLTFLGIGMTSVVLCDNAGFAWKVARQKSKVLFLLLEREYEFFKAARTIPSIAKHILRVYGFNREHIAIKRECLWGSPGRWADATRLFELHKKIGTETERIGWTPPEFKEDSYVFPGGGRPPILVDGGFSHRLGPVLVRYVKDVIRGRRRVHDTPSDLMFDIRREISYKAIRPQEAKSLTRHLAMMRPEG